MGAICPDCKQDMTLADGCKRKTIAIVGSGIFDRIPYGSEGRARFGRDDSGKILEAHRCHDCNVAPGKLHHLGCDVEECPSCGLQFISCGCLEDADIQTVPVTSQAMVPVNPPEIKIEDGFIRGFHHFSRSWYASRIDPSDDAVDDVMFGLYKLNGGCDGEIRAAWFRLTRSAITPQIAAYDDAWHLFVEFQDFFTDLANYRNQDITPLQFCEILLKHGFRDLTSTEPDR